METDREGIPRRNAQLYIATLTDQTQLDLINRKFPSRPIADQPVVLRTDENQRIKLLQFERLVF